MPSFSCKSDVETVTSLPIQNGIPIEKVNRRNMFEEKVPLKKYNWKEIETHNSAVDCWLVIHGKVYDVTSWIPSHPGGNIILNGAGRECTALFYSYHPLKVRNLLDPYLIGEVSNYSSFYSWNQSDFYPTLKRRVESYLESKRLNRGESWMMYAKLLSIVLGWMLLFYFSIIRGSIIAAIVFGFVHSHFGISIGHDGCHGSFSRSKYVNTLACFMTDLMGGSSIVWMIQHNIGHHPNSNLQGNTIAHDQNSNRKPTTIEHETFDDQFDPDVRSGFPVLRLNVNQPWHSYHRFQHIYVWFLFSIVGLRWYFNDIFAIQKRQYGQLRFFELTTRDLIYFSSMKFLFFLYGFVIPIVLHGFLRGLLIIIVYSSVTSYSFCLLFATNHLTNDVHYPNEKTTIRDWATLQVMTSCNYATDSFLANLFSASLNLQIEHHLFPYLPHVYLSSISSIVRATCEEYHIPYQCYSSYIAALSSYYKHLKIVGEGPDSESKRN